MVNSNDFGFDTSDFEVETVPYAQFINGKVPSDPFGLAIKKEVAEREDIKFSPDESSGFVLKNHYFKGKKEPDTLYISLAPKMLVLNEGPVLMAHKDDKKIPVSLFDKNRYSEGCYKAYSYIIIMLLDNNNQPLSEKPFRLKCSGFAGMSFKNFYYNYREPKKSFVQQYYEVYCKLTNSKVQPQLNFNKPSVRQFFAHAIYSPLMEVEEAVNAKGDSSWAAVTTGFVKPTEKNFESFLIPAKLNGKRNELSLKIEQWIEETQDWLSLKQANDEQNEFNGVENDIVQEDTPKPKKVIKGIDFNSKLKDLEDIEF